MVTVPTFCTVTLMRTSPLSGTASGVMFDETIAPGTPPSAIVSGRVVMMWSPIVLVAADDTRRWVAAYRRG